MKKKPVATVGKFIGIKSGEVYPYAIYVDGELVSAFQDINRFEEYVLYMRSLGFIVRLGE